MTVTVGVDGSESALEAVRWAVEEARTRGERLRLVHAETPLFDAPDLDRKVRARLNDQAWQVLREAARVAGDGEPELHVEVGAAAEVLVAESTRAGVLVLGTRGLGGFGALAVGSTAIAVTAHASCPVVVVRGEKPARPGPVVVGVHGGPHSVPVLAHAFEEAAARGVGVVAVHTWHPVVGDVVALSAGVDLAEYDALHGGRLARLLSPWRTRYRDVPVEVVVGRGSASVALLERAEDAALVVVGGRGHNSLTGLLLGSTSHALLHHAPCPVMVVHTEPRNT
ncbi:universal stress protein [Saccharothrix variisporea]|uniref:Nucleotide-binding universal stress UspA family protein n=1 Tax=Saccharothrix variisporea TaxID=543527 RepID=A0A495X5T2_9PSEU|nr:universal stress protein [Saccharothrix variisporea]RKT69237.1 nucleotide-binding universal stress UspA family protein [Saccharothrix variisporea]